MLFLMDLVQASLHVVLSLYSNESNSDNESVSTDVNVHFKSNNPNTMGSNRLQYSKNTFSTITSYHHSLDAYYACKIAET